MQEEEKAPESLSPEAQDALRSFISAIRAVKLYPPNNVAYSRTVKKSYESLYLFLGTAPEYRVEVQRDYFTSTRIPVGKEAQLNRAIAQDLFSKGVREIVFSEGIAEGELLNLCQALSLPSEELAIKGGISSILWEKGTTHIKVAEAGLDEVITTTAVGAQEDKLSAGADEEAAKKAIKTSGRSLVLGDLKTDPAGFGMGMIELAKQTRAGHESMEDRLFALYNEAGRKIREEHPDQSEEMFEALAQSAISLEQPYRDGLVAGKLYGELDAELESEQQAASDDQVPNELHEIVTGRFSTAWTAQQVSVLLKKTSAKKITPPSPPPDLAALEAVPVSQDLIEAVKEMAEYTPEEMEVLKDMSEVGMESDIIEAAVRTLIFLLPLVKGADGSAPGEKEIKLFSGVVRQLEDLLNYLLKKKDYDLAAFIIRVFHMPVDPAFKPRLAEAVKKASSKTAIAATINDLRKCSKDSPEYASAYSYLSVLEREVTEVLLELLAEETDRVAREFFMDMLKDLGKHQLMLFGEHLSDERWYFVRNIVNILGNSKTDDAIAFLYKVSGHKNVRIRQEVIKGLLSIGGKKAAGLLAKFLNDKDTEVQLMAIRGFAVLEGIGAHEAKPLVKFLEDLPIKKKGKEITLEAITALAKIGGPDAGQFLARYDHVRWWKPRKLQLELRAAAQRAMDEIKRREGDGGRATR
jgi:hypothetical protein